MNSNVTNKKVQPVLKGWQNQIKTTITLSTILTKVKSYQKQTLEFLVNINMYIIKAPKSLCLTHGVKNSLLGIHSWKQIGTKRL